MRGYSSIVSPVPSPSVAPSVPPVVSESPARQVWGLLVFSSGASVAVLVAGVLVLWAWLGCVDWRSFRYFLIVSAIPWALVSVLLALSTWRYALSVLEQITGYDLDQSGGVGDVPDIRIIPYKGPKHTIDGVVPDDLRYFVRAITQTKDWTQKTWRGVRLPSGRRCDNDYWSAMVAILRKIGVIVNGGPRSSGDLTIEDPTEILTLLGLNEID